jgi:transposase
VAVRWNPALKVLCARLSAAVKARKVALLACMCKLFIILNALLKHQPPWQANDALTP